MVCTEENNDIKIKTLDKILKNNSKWILCFAGVAKINLHDANLLISQGVFSIFFFFFFSGVVRRKALKTSWEGDTR